jgi:hypothetical protein
MKACTLFLAAIVLGQSALLHALTATGPAVLEISASADLVVRGTPDSAIRFSTPARSGLLPITNGVISFEGPGPVRIEIPAKTGFVDIRSISGGVDVSGIDGSVRTQAGAGKTVIDHIGGDVEAHSNGGPTLLGSIGGSVRCYSGGGSIRAAVVRGGGIFETDGGDIRIGDVLGAIRAITAAGGIHIDNAGGQVFADTFGGPISVLKALGEVIAATAGGPIEIGAAPSVDCRSSSGAIRLTNVSGALQAATARGTIVAEILAGRPLLDSYLATGSGDITVLVPSNISVTVEAEDGGSSDRRSIVSAFPAIRIMRRDATVLASGRINGGGPVLRIVDGGGRIEIKRK